MTRPAAAAAAAVAAAAYTAGAFAPAAASDTSAKPLLPDLVQASPTRLDGRTVRTAGGIRFRLGFASAVYNAGSGPLEVVGTRRSRSTPTMTATQLVRRSNGSVLRVANVGRLRYVRSETHQHWHLLGFEQYELRRASDGKILRRDKKTGFYLGDRYDAYPKVACRASRSRRSGRASASASARGS